jgi:hypothetical protein
MQSSDSEANRVEANRGFASLFFRFAIFKSLWNQGSDCNLSKLKLKKVLPSKRNKKIFGFLNSRIKQLPNSAVCKTFDEPQSPMIQRIDPIQYCYRRQQASLCYVYTTKYAQDHKQNEIFPNCAQCKLRTDSSDYSKIIRLVQTHAFVVKLYSLGSLN